MGGRSIPKAVRHFLNKADVIFGIGCSFATTNYGVRLPRNGPKYIQATLDAADLNKEMPIEHALLGDAELTLKALIAEWESERQCSFRQSTPSACSVLDALLVGPRRVSPCWFSEPP